MKFSVSLAVFCLIYCFTNITAKSIADQNDELIGAVMKGNLDDVKRLIQQGANINSTNVFGWSPLHWSAINGHFDLLEYLIENGANIEAKDLVGGTPLHFASLGGNLRVVKYLVANGANIETKNTFGIIAADIASSEGHPEVAEFLKNAKRTDLPSSEEKITTKYGDENDRTIESSLWTTQTVSSLEIERKAIDPKPQPERTLILLKPETVQRKLVGKIIERFEDVGLKLVALKLIQATKEMVDEHYGHLKNRTQYDEMVQYMRSGPIVPMVWEGKNAIEKTLKLIGQAEPGLSQPGTIRSDFGADGLHNIIHGSLSNETANKEIGIWFNQDEIISWTAADEQWTQF